MKALSKVDRVLAAKLLIQALKRTCIKRALDSIKRAICSIQRAIDFLLSHHPKPNTWCNKLHHVTDLSKSRHDVKYPNKTIPVRSATHFSSILFVFALPRAWHDSFTHSYLRQDSFLCVKWFILTITRSSSCLECPWVRVTLKLRVLYVSRNSFLRAT